MEKKTDNTQPEGPWRFDDGVTDVFDDMLERSIPQYEVMRASVTDVACRYRQHATEILDLGCSRGEAVAPLLQKYGATNRFVCVETSAPMLKAARERFAMWHDIGVVDVKEMDLRADFPHVRPSVTLSVLTLQFIPINYRQRILSNVFKATLPGGALIMVEKVLGETADSDALLVDHYHRMKKVNGYTDEDIYRKRLSLEGVLVPMTARWDEEMMRRAGFSWVECFWRWMNFAAWVAVRE